MVKFILLRATEPKRLIWQELGDFLTPEDAEAWVFETVLKDEWVQVERERTSSSGYRLRVGDDEYWIVEKRLPVGDGDGGTVLVTVSLPPNFQL